MLIVICAYIYIYFIFSALIWSGVAYSLIFVAYKYRAIYFFWFGNSSGFKRNLSSTSLMVWHRSTWFGRAKVLFHIFIIRPYALLYPFHFNFGIKIIVVDLRRKKEIKKEIWILIPQNRKSAAKVQKLYKIQRH